MPIAAANDQDAFMLPWLMEETAQAVGGACR